MLQYMLETLIVIAAARDVFVCTIEENNAAEKLPTEIYGVGNIGGS